MSNNLYVLLADLINSEYISFILTTALERGAYCTCNHKPWPCQRNGLLL